MDVKTEMPAAAGATHPPSHGCQGGVPWNRRPATPGRGRGVGVRVLVRAGSEKCRDVKPYDVMCPAQLRVNHRWGAWWSGVAS